MVEFCNACGTSLPKGDLTFLRGQVYTSHDYICPSCQLPANPLRTREAAAPEPKEDGELVFRKGEVRSE